MEKMEGGRKKFAKPPVKNACLTCRTSRIRCDGQQPCANCVDKSKNCTYLPSRRGGPRDKGRGKKSKDKAASYIPPEDSPPPVVTFEDQRNYLENFSSAGAGLIQVDLLPEDDVAFSDTIGFFDTCGMNEKPELFESQFNAHFGDLGTSSFGNSSGDVSSNEFSPLSMPSERSSIEVRKYGSDADLLDAYYVYIHAYFPVLPAPISFPPTDRPLMLEVGLNDYTPRSPVALALAALLALIPLPTDPNPKSLESTWKRRLEAHKYAQAALESVDNDSELIESSIYPSEALTNGSTCIHRPPFHRDVPLELDAVIALLFLSVYEYAQRGNIAKMKTRAGQALVQAMDMKLYEETDGPIQFREARRRAWWMTYISVCQGSISGSTHLSMDMYDPRFTIPYPAHTSDAEVWDFFITSQQAIVEATHYVLALNALLEKGSDLSSLYERTCKIEDLLQKFIKISDPYVGLSTSNMPIDATEAVVSRTLRAIGRMKLNSARIKLHRYVAFLDKPIFTKKHCDLHQKEEILPVNNIQPPTICTCGELVQEPAKTSTPPPEVFKSPETSATLFLPFASDYSTEVCCVAAINIAKAYETLPYPNPTGVIDSPGHPGSPLNNMAVVPRMMPTFACCAMQSAYALLMLVYKANAAIAQNSDEDLIVLFESHIDALHQNLQLILATLENYSIASEALEGMRDQIWKAMNVEFENVC